MKPKQYTLQEEARLARLISEGGEPRCPSCQGIMGSQPVEEPEGTAYVRDRVWLTCESCRRSVVLDRRRIQGR